MQRLRGLALEVLAALPVEPNGLSLHELADGLLGRRDPAARGRVRAALGQVAAAFGELYVRRGDCEEFGRYDVPLYGVRGHQAAAVRAFLARRDAAPQV